jgi:hypothetical protein
VNQTQFVALQVKCIAVLENYFTEARKTSVLLQGCTLEPLAFKERFALLSQEIIEKDALLLYLEVKRLLHSAALLGYGALPQDYSTGATLAVLN